jgi:signal peptidase I
METAAAPRYCPDMSPPRPTVGRPGNLRRAQLISGVRTLVLAAIDATLIATFGFQVVRVDGYSMAPTLEDHDRLIVNKLAYELGDPRPGDIVTLYYPRDPDRLFVKRLIAREGDSVRIVHGRVYVNGQPLRDDYVIPDFRDNGNWGPQVIGPGYDFVLGDHRTNSFDSRHWGLVPKKYITGKVEVRWWPLQDVKIF